MNSKFVDVSNMVSIEEMLSSSTYYIAHYYNHCVYCHQAVNNNKEVIWNEISYVPYRCSCNNAQHEITLKENVLYKLKEIEEMNRHINMNIIDENTQIVLEEMEEKYKTLQRRNI